MSLTDLIMIAAVFLGPIVAVRLTRHLDDRKEVRERKLWIFKTLMASRATGLSIYHVEALNRIDLEFSTKDKKEKAVIEAWKEYLDILNNTAISPDQWAIRRADLLVELLHKMARVLDFEFDKPTIRNSTYMPRAHSELEEEQAAIRKGLKDIIDGKRVVPIFVTNLASQHGSGLENEG